VKTAALYLVPIKSYSKNTHPPSFLEWAVDTIRSLIREFIMVFIVSYFEDKEKNRNHIQILER
jgi:hypothetical protein